MKKVVDEPLVESLFLIFILFVSFFLFFFNLGNQYLWQDEAQTALISKTILTYGIPHGYDGQNSFSQELGRDYTKNYVWILHPWLPFYVIAAFFKLFGVNTFVSRLPAALFGIGTVFLTWYFCKALWQSRTIAFTAAFLLLVSVPFLLLSRQCRYYSIAAFFSLLGLYAYVRILDGKKYRAYAVFVLSAASLFNTQYSCCIALLSTVILHTLFFRRQKFREVLLLAVVSVLINVPWIIWLLSAGRGQINVQEFLKSGLFVPLIKTYIERIGRYIFPFYLFLVVLLVSICSRIRNGYFISRDRLFWERLLLLLLFIFINLVILGVISSYPFFRYLTPLIPIFVIITALLVISAARVHPAAAAAILALLIFTSPLKDFLYEITHDYDGPVEGIVKYLNKNGSRNDVVVITYDDMPLKFYTQMRVLGGFTGEDLSPAKKAKWIILRKHLICLKDKEIREYLVQNLQGEDYEEVTIDYPDIPTENREDPAYHYYRTVIDEKKVTILKRIR